MPNITMSDYPTATTYILNDSPGYQVDFYPIKESKDPPMTLDDCRVFGIPFDAIQICLKKSNSSLLAGMSNIITLVMLAWNACPPDIMQEGDCLNSTDWRIVDPYNTKMTISSRRASTVYSRSNFTIIDVINLSDPSPVDYSPEDFFSFYEVIFNID